MVLHGAAWCCIVLHCAALCCMVLHGAAWCCMVLHGAAWCCMVLHGAAELRLMHGAEPRRLRLRGLCMPATGTGRFPDCHPGLLFELSESCRRVVGEWLVPELTLAVPCRKGTGAKDSHGCPCVGFVRSASPRGFLCGTVGFLCPTVRALLVQPVSTPAQCSS
jgi:hypothetical protein